MVPCGTHACGILAKKKEGDEERQKEREREASIGWKRGREIEKG